MAPSPELGQPKAPDKSADGSSTKGESSSSSGDSKDVAAASTLNAQIKDEDFSTWPEDTLKGLLDEAITFKGPGDLAHKSKTFKYLFHKTESDDQESDFYSGQGGSLQDLADSNKLDDSFGRTKKHQHQRHHKYSSVSSRQREGGSLPTNVNVSLNSRSMCPDEPRFLKEVHKKKVHSNPRKSHDVGKKESQYMNDNLGQHPIDSTIINIGEWDMDETQHLLAHDSLAQPTNDPQCSDSGLEMSACHKIPRVQYTSQAKIEISESSNMSGSGTSMRAHSHHQGVDKTVSFDLIDNSRNKNSVDSMPISMNSSYPSSVTSCVDTKSDVRSTNSSVFTNIGSMGNTKLIQTPNILSQKHYDENANPLQNINSTLQSSSQPNKSKSKKSKSERNTVIVDYSKKEGFRGNDDINDLVRYIELKETEKREKNKNSNNNNNNNGNSNNNSYGNTNNNNNSAVLNNNNNNNANSSNNKKSKNKNKLKRCNSLEELSSCSKLKELKEAKEEEGAAGGDGGSDDSGRGGSSGTNDDNCGGVSGGVVGGSSCGASGSNNADDGIVTLRQKNSKNKNNSEPTNTTPTTGLSTSKKLSQQKRTERRSWGTEELSYLGDNNNKVVEKESCDENASGGSGVTSVVATTSTTSPTTAANNSTTTTKKEKMRITISDHIIITSALSDESISLSANNPETSEFCVVTKKKKPKKKQDDHIMTRNNNQQNATNLKNSSGNNQRHQQNGNQRLKYNNTNQSNFVNDRDVYMNSLETNRRKSTSSVPPSERSDSSDLDSVHSLPIESSSSKRIAAAKETASRQNSNNNLNNNNNNNNTKMPKTAPDNTPSQISYADIAKTSNEKQQGNTLTMDKWPIISASNSSNNTDANKMIVEEEEQRIVPEVVIKMPTAAAMLNGEVKKFLHKSKSVDNDNYNVSIDQYPALEKTVKKSKSIIPEILSPPIIMTATVTNVSPAPVHTSKKKSSTPNKIEPIEVSQIEKCIVDEIYHNSKIQPTLKQVVVNNNNNVNIQKLNEYNSVIVPHNGGIPIQPTATPNPSPASSATTATFTAKPQRQSTTNHHHNPISSKKDKHTTSSSTSSSSSVSIKNTINQIHNANCGAAAADRPAVIILNDIASDKANEDITFGFEVNQNLLFGDFNEEELQMLEQQTSPSTTTSSSSTKAKSSSNNSNSDISDYFSISESSFELAQTTATTTPMTQSQNTVENVKTSSPNANAQQHVNNSVNDSAVGGDNDMSANSYDNCNNNEVKTQLKNNSNSSNDINSVSIDKHMADGHQSSCVSVASQCTASLTTGITADESITTTMTSNSVAAAAGTATASSGVEVSYKAPNLDEIDLTGYNHDKIVSFITSAWDNIIFDKRCSRYHSSTSSS